MQFTFLQVIYVPCKKYAGRMVNITEWNPIEANLYGN
jgi:hypothetical protein